MNPHDSEYIKKNLKYLILGSLKTEYSYIIWGKQYSPRSPISFKKHSASYACFATFFRALKQCYIVNVCRLRVSIYTKVENLKYIDHYCPFTNDEIKEWLDELVLFLGSEHIKYKLVPRDGSIDVVFNFYKLKTWAIAFTAIYTRLLYEGPDNWILKEAFLIRNYSEEYKKLPLFSILMGLSSSKYYTHAFGVNGYKKHFKVLNLTESEEILSSLFKKDFAHNSVDASLINSWPSITVEDENTKRILDTSILGSSAKAGTRMTSIPYVTSLLGSDTPSENLIDYFKYLLHINE